MWLNVFVGRSPSGGVVNFLKPTSGALKIADAASDFRVF